ncbi:hypothetical protein JS756_30705 [Streptomyces actuosus]|uniref:ABC transporter permease n=1 Tax=Streptomyces actuosus TaxID=1885 RepID=A0ABS2VZE8_STRAS|nr:hypothetical protein [Streptomyces actuosus]MBN0048398.1 hypothetical protein [Streptomyces actuosus]
MSATSDTTTSPTCHSTGEHRPLARIVVRQLIPLALVLFLATLVFGALLVHHYQQWADAAALRDHVGNHAYHFGRYPHDAHNTTATLLADGKRIAFLPALCAAAITGLLTGGEWGTRRFALTLAQTVSARRWFAARWTGLAVLFTALLLPLVMLYRFTVVHAFDLDLLTYGVDRQTVYFTVGPVTVAYLLLGVAAGALTGTALRRTWPSFVAAPALTWLVAAVLVRSRAALLLDFPAYSEVHGMHGGGVLGLQFYDLLPTDSYVLNSLQPGDYWPYQLAESTLVVTVAALFALVAFRTLRRRTGQP